MAEQGLPATVDFGPGGAHPRSGHEAWLGWAPIRPGSQRRLGGPCAGTARVGGSLAPTRSLRRRLSRFCGPATLMRIMRSLWPWSALGAVLLVGCSAGSNDGTAGQAGASATAGNATAAPPPGGSNAVGGTTTTGGGVSGGSAAGGTLRAAPPTSPRRRLVDVRRWR